MLLHLLIVHDLSVIADRADHPVVPAEAFRPTTRASRFARVDLTDSDARSPAIRPAVVVRALLKNRGGAGLGLLPAKRLHDGEVIPLGTPSTVPAPSVRHGQFENK